MSQMLSYWCFLLNVSARLMSFKLAARHGWGIMLVMAQTLELKFCALQHFTGLHALSFR